MYHVVFGWSKYNPLVPALCLMCLVLSGGGVTKEEDGTVPLS
jgi:hypothetical protein